MALLATGVGRASMSWSEKSAMVALSIPRLPPRESARRSIGFILAILGVRPCIASELAPFCCTLRLRAWLIFNRRCTRHRPDQANRADFVTALYLGAVRDNAGSWKQRTTRDPVMSTGT